MFITSCDDNGISNSKFYEDDFNMHTYENIYNWANVIGGKGMIVNGEMKSDSHNTYISNVGIDNNPESFINFLKQSDGKLEKYDTRSHKWIERTNLLYDFIENPTPMKIERNNTYILYAPLFCDTVSYKEEIGQYRLRIDYYDLSDSLRILTYHSYSNVFEIK